MQPTWKHVQSTTIFQENVTKIVGSSQTPHANASNNDETIDDLSNLQRKDSRSGSASNPY